RSFLGIEVAQFKSGIAISQRKYALDILEETGMTDCRPIDSPMDSNVKLLPGKLNYLTVSQPDITFSISVISQFLIFPCDSHCNILGEIWCLEKVRNKMWLLDLVQKHNIALWQWQHKTYLLGNFWFFWIKGKPLWVPLITTETIESVEHVDELSSIMEGLILPAITFCEAGRPINLLEPASTDGCTSE
uniref:Reverse transcriptase Ty1/copia-type domain-containing protein n=1 Tax=Solanum lycopersicum TaxID=4081 RepID=A0A3Q7HPF3_SOLLC